MTTIYRSMINVVLVSAYLSVLLSLLFEARQIQFAENWMPIELVLLTTVVDVNSYFLPDTEKVVVPAESF